MLHNPVLLCIDVGGTLTRWPGYDIVKSDLFQQLLQGYKVGVIQSYEDTIMKSAEEMQAIFVQAFGEYQPDFNFEQPNAGILIQPAALNFLYQALLNPDISICFITKNHSNFIRALLAYQGFTQEQISKITILEGGYKDESMSLFIHQKPPHQQYAHFFIFDDNQYDGLAIYSGAIRNQYSAGQISLYHEEPGSFHWDIYMNDIESKIAEISTFTDSVFAMIRNEHIVSALNPRDALIQSTRNPNAYCLVALSNGDLAVCTAGYLHNLRPYIERYQENFENINSVRAFIREHFLPKPVPQYDPNRFFAGYLGGEHGLGRAEPSPPPKPGNSSDAD